VIAGVLFGNVAWWTWPYELGKVNEDGRGQEGERVEGLLLLSIFHWWEGWEGWIGWNGGGNLHGCDSDRERKTFLAVENNHLVNDNHRYGFALGELEASTERIAHARKYIVALAGLHIYSSC